MKITISDNRLWISSENQGDEYTIGSLISCLKSQGRKAMIFTENYGNNPMIVIPLPHGDISTQISYGGTTLD